MIYILQFSEPLGERTKKHGTAQYYLGWCEDHRLDQRLHEHRMGQGAAITRAAVERDITLALVLTIPGATRQDERRLKNWKSHKRVIARYGKDTA